MEPSSLGYSHSWACSRFLAADLCLAKNGMETPPHTPLEASVLLNFFISLAPGWGWPPSSELGWGWAGAEQEPPHPRWTLALPTFEALPIQGAWQEFPSSPGAGKGGGGLGLVRAAGGRDIDHSSLHSWRSQVVARTIFSSPSPGNLDSSLCFFQPRVSHDVLCIEVK